MGTWQNRAHEPERKTGARDRIVPLKRYKKAHYEVSCKEIVFIETRRRQKRYFLLPVHFCSVVRLDLIKGKTINKDGERVETLALKFKTCTAETNGSILICFN